VKATIFIAIVLTAAVAGLGRAAAATQRSTTVTTATSKLGRILVDSRGRTLYLFEKDSRRASRPPAARRSRRCSASPVAPTGRRR
jgi:predicted lipoprotein with Yx(FWY)xxD motif